MAREKTLKAVHIFIIMSLYHRKVAVVQCLGGCHAEAVIPRGDLAGDCSQVLADHPDGILKCKWGCLGMGSCVAACKSDAIHINSFGAAEVDRGKCVGCGLCAKECPVGVIHVPAAYAQQVMSPAQEEAPAANA